MIYKKRDGILQIKIFFVGLLIGSSYLIGDTIYKSFIKRHKELNEVIEETILGMREVAEEIGLKGDI